MLLAFVRVVLTRKSLLRSSISQEERRERRREGAGPKGLAETTSPINGLVDLFSSGWGEGVSEKAESDSWLAEGGSRDCFIPLPDSVSSIPTQNCGQFRHWCNSWMHIRIYVCISWNHIRYVYTHTYPSLERSLRSLQIAAPRYPFSSSWLPMESRRQHACITHQVEHTTIH